MSRETARAFIEDRLKELRKLSYERLLTRIGHPESEFVKGLDGAQYQLEVQVFWDSAKGGNIRVMVAADGGGVSAMRPMSGDFILSPDGSFVAE